MYPPLESIFPLTPDEHYRLDEHKKALEERRGSIEHEIKTANAKLEAKLPASDRQVGGDHYKKMGIQVWYVVDTWPRDQQIGYYRGGALKYLMRMGSKDEQTQEIAKGIHYLEKLLEVLKNS